MLCGASAMKGRALLPTAVPCPRPPCPADGSGMRHLNCAFSGPGLKPMSNGRASDEASALVPRRSAAQAGPGSARARQSRGAALPHAWLCLAPLLQGAFSNLAMNGQEVFKFAVRAVPTVSRPAAPAAPAGTAGPPPACACGGGSPANSHRLLLWFPNGAGVGACLVPCRVCTMLPRLPP